MLDMTDDDDVRIIGTSNISNSLLSSAFNALIERRKRRRLESSTSSTNFADSIAHTSKQESTLHLRTTSISELDSSADNFKSSNEIKGTEPLIITAYGQYMKTGTYTLPKFCEEMASTAAATKIDVPSIKSAAKSVRLPKVAFLPTSKNAGAWAKVKLNTSALPLILRW